MARDGKQGSRCLQHMQLHPHRARRPPSRMKDPSSPRAGRACRLAKSLGASRVKYSAPKATSFTTWAVEAVGAVGAVGAAHALQFGVHAGAWQRRTQGGRARRAPAAPCAAAGSSTRGKQRRRPLGNAHHGHNHDARDGAAGGDKQVARGHVARLHVGRRVAHKAARARGGGAVQWATGETARGVAAPGPCMCPVLWRGAPSAPPAQARPRP